VHIAEEETKFGLDENELHELLNTNSNELGQLYNVEIKGLMGMASFTENEKVIRSEFKRLKLLFDKYAPIWNASIPNSKYYLWV
jgi:uncharacterized pyridoxal phosphate-containing UPF0001 family protein